VIEIRFDPAARPYTGRELRSHFALDTFGIVGDSAVAFVGPCKVELSEMVDLVDVRAGASIASPLMVHFIVEHFGVALLEMVLRQRLLARLCGDLLREQKVGELLVRGNDLYVAGRKASVCVATRSPVSSLIHLGVNVRTEGTPVPAWGLAERGLAPETFAGELLSRYAREMDDVRRAAAKVKGVP
jgi:uncharacterized protein